MGEYDYGYSESVWSLIGVNLLGNSPFLLAYIAGLIVAIIFLSKRTKPAVCVAISMGLSFVATIGAAVAQAFLYHAMNEGRLVSEEISPYIITIGLVQAVVHIVALALLVFAALAWRQPGAFGAVAPLPGAMQASNVDLGAGPTKPISKGLYILLIFGLSLLSMALVIPAIGILIAQNEDLIFVSLGFSCMAMIGGTVSAVMSIILIYKLWATIQDGPARTTPGKAVGFLFIPFFSLYWVFQAVWGWSVDFNKYTAERGIAARRVPEGMALTLCIIAVIPYVNILATPVTIVISWIYLSKAIDGANAVRSARAGAHPT